MVYRNEVEMAIANVLKRSNIKNVTMPVSTEKKKYPLVIVEMTGEEKDHYLSSSKVTVEIMILSALVKNWEEIHYDTLRNVLDALSQRGANGLYKKLQDLGLNVLHVFNAMDGGTVEMRDGNGSPIVQSNVVTELQVM